MKKEQAYPVLKQGPAGYHFESPVQIGSRLAWVQIHATDAPRSAGCVQWVDIPTDGFSTDGLDLEVHTISFDEPVGAVMPTSDPNKAVVALERRLVCLDLQDRSVSDADGLLGAVIESNPEMRLNDCRAGFDGAVYAGLMAYDCETPMAHWGRVSAAAGYEAKIHDVKISNGFDWTEESVDDAGRPYRDLVYVDSKSGRVDTHDDEAGGHLESSEIWTYRHYIDDGSLGPREVLANMSSHAERQVSGCPAVVDGGVMSFDADGRAFYVAAIYNGAAAFVVDVESGEVVGRIDVPALKVTSVGWAGDVLVFSTTREGLSGATPAGSDSAFETKLAGSGNLFWVKPEGLLPRKGFVADL